MEIRMIQGDRTNICKLPIPFKDQQGKVIGQIVSVRFDGRYTLGTVKMNDEIKPSDLGLPETLQGVPVIIDQEYAQERVIVPSVQEKTAFVTSRKGGLQSEGGPSVTVWPDGTIETEEPVKPGDAVQLASGGQQMRAGYQNYTGNVECFFDDEKGIPQMAPFPPAMLRKWELGKVLRDPTKAEAKTLLDHIADRPANADLRRYLAECAVGRRPDVLDTGAPPSGPIKEFLFVADEASLVEPGYFKNMTKFINAANEDVLDTGATSLEIKRICEPFHSENGVWNSGLIAVPKREDRQFHGIAMSKPSEVPPPFTATIGSGRLQQEVPADETGIRPSKFARIDVDEKYLPFNPDCPSCRELALRAAGVNFLSSDLPLPYAQLDNLDLLRRVAWEADQAKYLLRDAGLGVTGDGLLEMVQEVVVDIEDWAAHAEAAGEKPQSPGAFVRAVAAVERERLATALEFAAQSEEDAARVHMPEWHKGLAETYRHNANNIRKYGKVFNQ